MPFYTKEALRPGSEKNDPRGPRGLADATILVALVFAVGVIFFLATSAGFYLTGQVETARHCLGMAAGGGMGVAFCAALRFSIWLMRK